MAQPENETGSYRVPRDYSAEGNRLFSQHIPAALAAATGKSGTWEQAFGKQAPRAFNTWYVASFVNAVAKAGKAVKPLPMRSEEHTSELQSLMRNSYAVF